MASSGSVGPALLLPTATTRFLGAESSASARPWSPCASIAAGPTASWQTISGRSPARATPATSTPTFLQPFLTYTFKTHTTLGINTESTYDWATTKWTVPINPFVSQILKIGPQPISLQLGPKLYVGRSDGSAGLGPAVRRSSCCFRDDVLSRASWNTLRAIALAGGVYLVAGVPRLARLLAALRASARHAGAAEVHPNHEWPAG